MRKVGNMTLKNDAYRFFFYGSTQHMTVLRMLLKLSPELFEKAFRKKKRS